MEIDKQTDKGCPTPPAQMELCNIIVETHQAYWEDVINAGMPYEDFVSNFFGAYNGFFCHDNDMANGYKEVHRMFTEHQPIIEHRFKFSVFESEDAQEILMEFDHCNSFLIAHYWISS